MILEHQVPAYLQCLPYLWSFAPMEHVATYFENFCTFSNKSTFVRGKGLFPCLANTLKFYGPRTWELIPIAVLGSALEKCRCDKDVVDLLSHHLESFPPEAVLEIMRRLHKRAGGEAKPMVLAKLLESMSPECIGHLLLLEDTPEIRQLLLGGVQGSR
jgi:hypothetical protein